MAKFVDKMISSNTEVSSKRVAGIFGWFLFCVVLVVSMLLKYEITDIQGDLMSVLAYSSVALIAGGTVENVFNKKQNIQ